MVLQLSAAPGLQELPDPPHLQAPPQGEGQDAPGPHAAAVTHVVGTGQAAPPPGLDPDGRRLRAPLPPVALAGAEQESQHLGLVVQGGEQGGHRGRGPAPGQVPAQAALGQPLPVHPGQGHGVPPEQRLQGAEGVHQVAPRHAELLLEAAEVCGGGVDPAARDGEREPADGHRGTALQRRLEAEEGL